MSKEKRYRNKKIIEKYKLGYTQGDLSRAYNLSRQRVYNIIKEYLKSYPQKTIDKKN
jgi:Mor family transcriptional regulator